ncbi:MAG: phospholipid carrier-dependent glycosyltransferase [Candidatus Zixiibacteriota bacterium]|nr:MAG: phospholipid carrier-dependent glycosyltransferase [candidate division Zixibacteria bacterium]
MNRLDPSRWFASSYAIPGLLAGAGFLLHLLFLNRYGIFRDELYYLACGEHMDWGYVDQPPFVALVAAFSRTMLGDSLYAIRLIPALAGAGVVFLAGLVAKLLGGGRFAQALAALAVILAPVNLFLHHILSMNVFDHLFWALAAWLVIRIIQTEQPRYWIFLGLVMGLGLQNKISMLFFGFGLTAGLLLTRHRRWLKTPWPWIAAGIAGLIFLPHILWQIHYGWPTLEFMRNARLHKMTPMSPLQFLGVAITEMHPLGFLILALGIGHFLWHRQNHRYRVMGWLFLAVFGLLIVQQGKPYYLSPTYPFMFAGGAVALEGFIRKGWLRAAVLVIILIGGLLTTPLTLPVLSPEQFIRYAQALGLSHESGERHEMGPLPQHYADQFGWEEMVEKIAQAYHSLPPEDQVKCAIYVENYGEAGAIDFLGRKHGLPKAICAHNSYYLWGPRGYTGEIIIELNDDEDFEDLQRHYDQVERRGQVYHPYAMPYENNLSVYLCRGLKRPLAKIWPMLKHYI